MRIAIATDIHGNRHALEAVIADARDAGVDELWCLGDVVGYGAEPDECCRLVSEHFDLCLVGNHDLAVTGKLPLTDFSHGAAVAAQWTQEAMEREWINWLARLRPQSARDGYGLFHASPRDPVWEYVLSALLADLCLDAARHRVSFIGHSHVALSFSREEGGGATGEVRRPGDRFDLSKGSWLINPGSVGQPRDGDWRAAWLLLDTTAPAAEWRRVEYDVNGAAAAIRAARLPESLADRLYHGQ